MEGLISKSKVPTSSEEKGVEQVFFKKRNFSEVLVLVLGELKVQVVWKGRRWMAVEADPETKPKKKSLRLGSHFLFLWLFTSVNLKVLFCREAI